MPRWLYTSWSAPCARSCLARIGVERLRLGTIDQATVWADPDRLKQVLLILVDNALKYTPADGQVTVSC